MKRPIKYRAYIPDLDITLENITLYGDGNMGYDEDEFNEALPTDHVLDHDYECVIRKFKDEDGDDDLEKVLHVLLGEDWIYLEEGQFEPLQFTGFLLNKQEIYEGDKLQFKYEDKVEEEGFGIVEVIVTFENGCFVVKEPGFDYEGNHETPETLFDWLKNNECVLIPYRHGTKAI